MYLFLRMKLRVCRFALPLIDDQATKLSMIDNIVTAELLSANHLSI
tara:strand:- start:24187 stop:24324 length:138 start_codon:yes stop_codon:yes gene_type:complete